MRSVCVKEPDTPETDTWMCREPSTECRGHQGADPGGRAGESPQMRNMLQRGRPLYKREQKMQRSSRNKLNLRRGTGPRLSGVALSFFLWSRPTSFLTAFLLGSACVSSLRVDTGTDQLHHLLTTCTQGVGICEYVPSKHRNNAQQTHRGGGAVCKCECVCECGGLVFPAQTKTRKSLSAR